MSQITQLHYRRLVNLGNFENEAIELVFELAPGEAPEAVLATARAWVAQQMQPLLPPYDPGPAPAPDDSAPPASDPEWEALTPAAPAPANARPTGTVTDKQLKAIYAIGRSRHGWNDAAVEAACHEQFHCGPDELSKSEASQFIDALKDDGAEAI